MAEEEISIVSLLKKKLQEEMEYKKRCDNGEISYWDIEYEDNMILDYSQEDSSSKVSRWNEILGMVER